MLRSGLLALLVVSLGVCLVNAEYPRRPRLPQPTPGDEWGPDGRRPRPHHSDEWGPDGKTPRPRDFPRRHPVIFRGDCRRPHRGGCQHVCQPLLPRSFLCFCRPGFILIEDGKSCYRDGDEGEAPWDKPDFEGGFSPSPRPGVEGETMWPSNPTTWPHLPSNDPDPGHHYPTTDMPRDDDDDDNSWPDNEEHPRGKDGDGNMWPEEDDGDDNSIEGKSHRIRHGNHEEEERRLHLFVGLAVAFGLLVVFTIVLTVVLCCICKRRRLAGDHQASSAASVTSDPPAYDSISVRSHNGGVITATPVKMFPDLEKGDKKRAPSNVYVTPPLETKAKY